MSLTISRRLVVHTVGVDVSNEVRIYQAVMRRLNDTDIDIDIVLSNIAEHRGNRREFNDCVNELSAMLKLRIVTVQWYIDQFDKHYGNLDR